MWTVKSQYNTGMLTECLGWGGAVPPWIHNWSFLKSAGLLHASLSHTTEMGHIYFFAHSLALPLGTIFWTLFADTGTSIIWEPKLTVESVFAFIGLLIILPPMVLYDYFGRRIDTSMSGFIRFYYSTDLLWLWFRLIHNILRLNSLFLSVFLCIMCS